MRYSFDQFTLDTDRFEVCENGKPIHAEPQVLELLAFFARNPGRLISRDELIQAVWKGRVVSDSAISGRIKMARKALGDDGRQQKYIRTVHKKGFSFTAGGLREEADRQGSRHPQLSAIAPRRKSDSRPSIGVFKFANLNADVDRSFFADGISEDLVTTLSKISRLTVVSHPEPIANEDRTIDVRQAGIDLDVAYVLHGSVRVDGDRIRISVHLVDSENGEHLWAQRYDCLNRELFESQDEITKQVVSALQVELTEGEQALMLSRGTGNIEAWQLTFQGQAAVLEHHQASVRRGLGQLQQAVQLDPEFALAWSALAAAHWKQYLNENWSESRTGSLDLAVEASDRAVALQPNNAAVLAMRSLIFVSYRRFDEALALAQQALRLANSEANTIALAGITLRACCQPQQAIRYTRKAMELSPLYPAWYPYGIAVCHWIMGEPEQALDYLREAREIDPDLSLIYLVFAMIYAETGQDRGARAAVESILRIDPGFSSRAFTEGMPFSDPAIQARREAALTKAGMPK